VGGCCLQAQDNERRPILALKFLPENPAPDPHALDVFAAKARGASALNHPIFAPSTKLGLTKDARSSPWSTWMV